MKLFRWLLIFALVSPVMAQNVRFDLPIYTVQAQGGNLLPVYAIPGAGVKFYSCSGSVCTTLATTYISATSATTCPTSPTPMQVTLNGSSTCVSSADPYGNMGGWFQSGQYMATITAQGGSYNYYFTVGNAGSSNPCVSFPFGLGCGGTGASTAAGAQSNLLGNPAAGEYIFNCTSTSACAPLSFTGGGGYPASYTCTGVPSTDLAAINADLAVGGVYLYLNSQTNTCAINGQIIVFPNDTLNWSGQSIVSTLNNTTTALPQFSITNNAVVNPTTHFTGTCALTAGSTSVTCSTAIFTISPYTGAPNGDMEQSFSCANALASGVALQTSIGQVDSATSITLVDPTGSGITPGNFTCSEQLRDHDMHLIAGQISMTGPGGGGVQYPFELGFGHANRVTVEGGNWNNPDGTSSWHQVYWDVTDVSVKDLKCQAHTSYGQDCIDFEGPWRKVSTQNISCDETDDCVALKPGEFLSLTGSPFLNTSGNGSGASIINTQGSDSSHGIVIYSPSCMNSSGNCVSSNVNDVVVDTVIGQPIFTSTVFPPSVGFAFPVEIQCTNPGTSDCGTHAYTDHLRFSHILGTGLNISELAPRVQIGANPIAFNQYYGNIEITDVGPDNSTSGADYGAIYVATPTNTSFSTNITTLTIHDAGYSGYKALLGANNSNGTITNLYSDNPVSANYNLNGLTVTHPYLGYQVAYTSQANTYGAFMQDFSAATVRLPVAAGYTGSATGQIGFDSTNVNWRAYLAGIGDYFMALFPTSGITSGDCVEFLKTTNRWSLQDAGTACNVATVASVSNSDGTLTITPTTGAVVASLALSHANTWTANQTFQNVSAIFDVTSPSNPSFVVNNTGGVWTDGTGHLTNTFGSTVSLSGAAANPNSIFFTRTGSGAFAVGLDATSSGIEVNNGTQGNASGNLQAATITAGTQFSGPGTGLSGTAASLNIGGNAATATNLASYPTLCSGGQFSQGLSSGSNNCLTPPAAALGLPTKAYTSSQTAVSADNGYLVVMNCSSCSYTLPVSQPATQWTVAVQFNGTGDSIALSGGATYNGGSSGPTVNEYSVIGPIVADQQTTTDYFGPTPTTAGSNVTVTAAKNGLTVAASAPGTGTVTSVATTSPITGGTITTTGTIGCATCLTATSPSAGLAAFSGGGQGMSAATAAQVGTTLSIAANAVIKSAGTTSAPVASSITDNGTTIASAEPLVLGTATCTTFGTAGGMCAAEGTSATNVSGTSNLYPDSTAHEWKAATNGSTSYGLLERAQPGAVNQTGQTGAISTATLCAASAGACNVAGQYRVDVSFTQGGTACAVVTAGSVAFSVTYTDANGTTHSAATVPIDNQATPTALSGAFTFTTSNATGAGSGTMNIWTNGTVIQYATAYTACTSGTGTYNVNATVTRLQ